MSKHDIQWQLSNTRADSKTFLQVSDDETSTRQRKKKILSDFALFTTQDKQLNIDVFLFLHCSWSTVSRAPLPLIQNLTAPYILEPGEE